MSRTSGLYRMVSVRLAFANILTEQRHDIDITAVVDHWDPEEISEVHLTASYFSGDLNVEVGTHVATFYATYEAPNESDLGNAGLSGRNVTEHATYSGGKIEIEIDQLQGIGLGSILMKPLVHWLQLRADTPMRPINLDEDDAPTASARSRRNDFYAKLGFRFASGSDQSLPMDSSGLRAPAFRAGQDWSVQISSKTAPPSTYLLDIDKLLLRLG